MLLARPLDPTAGAASLPDDETHSLPCRPTIACTADIVAPGLFELEAGYLYRQLAGEVNQQSVPFLAKLTVAEWLQIQVGDNGPTFADGPVAVRYVDDIATGLKFHLVDQRGWQPSISVSATLSVPISSAQGFVRTYDALFTMYVSKDFGWLHEDFNVGLNLWRLESPVKVQPWAALSLSVGLPAGFGTMLEGYVFADASPISPKDAGMLTGVTYSPKPWLVFDLGVDIGLIHSTRVLSVFTGVTVVPVRVWEK
jgi:hypothetical protein